MMGTIHVIFQKEMVDSDMMEGNIAVVIDVFLATTTIAAVLEKGAASVFAVKDSLSASDMVKDLPLGNFLLAGELEGRVISGFLPPWPTTLTQHDIKGMTIVLSTSNGTVAIDKVHKAKKVYTSSFVNGEAVADYIRTFERDEDIIIVCSGSDGSFSLEDFLGAGYFLDCLLGMDNGHYILTDAAKTVLYFYQKHHASYDELLQKTMVGRELYNNGLENEVLFASSRGIFTVVPQLIDNKLINVNK